MAASAGPEAECRAANYPVVRCPLTEASEAEVSAEATAAREAESPKH